MSLRWFARAAGRLPGLARLGWLIVPADRFVARLTGGRLIALGTVPALLLTTTGRRSGQPRTVPLQYIPDGDSFLVIGSNWGGPRHPAWALNLLAEPAATVVHKGERFPVRATVLAGAERERAWQLSLRQWPAYQQYTERAGDRQLHLFRLRRPPPP
jgi:deazaflavin-dependent oxidoreductase (nitroreductase family)